VSERETLVVGRIVKAHGLKGDVIVDLTTDRSERLDVGSVLETARGPLTVTFAAHHQSVWRVRFAEIPDRNAADLWRGVELRAERLEIEGVLWIDQLFGATVFDRHGQSRGVVTDVLANPASDLLVLDDGHLVPLTFVTTVIPHERIDVVEPEGLFE
jgi:16S rRNA processing protein RimM